MVTIDCSTCPAPPTACHGCVVSELARAEPQVIELFAESCGYVLSEDVRVAIEVLIGVGLVSEPAILGVEGAA